MKVLLCGLLLLFPVFSGLVGSVFAHPAVVSEPPTPERGVHYWLAQESTFLQEKYYFLLSENVLPFQGSGVLRPICNRALNPSIFQKTIADPIKISMKEVLASVNQDEQWRLSQQTVNWLGQQNYQNPLLQKLELRAGSNDFSLTRQQYGIRVSPNAFGLSKYQKQYQQAQSGVLQAEAEVYWNEALLQRYEAIVAYHFAQQLTLASQKLDSLYQAQEQVFRAMLRQGLSVKVKEVVENEQDRQALRLDQAQFLQAKSQAEEKIRQFIAGTGAVELELPDFISIARIEQVIARIQANSLEIPLAEAKIRQAQMGLVQSEMDLLKVRNREYLSFFQFGYERAPKTPTLDDDLFMRLGLNIPLNSNNRFKNNELALEMYELNTKNTLTLSRRKQELDVQLNKVRHLIQEHQLLKEQEEKNLLLNILEDPTLRASLTPTELMEVKLLQQKKQFARLKLSEELTQEYIQLLYLNGQLSQKPLLNYLSTNLEPW